jgi:fatty acid desaturase
MRLWRYSALDALLLTIAVLQFAATTAWAVWFDRLPIVANLPIFAVLAFVFYFNPIVVTHNFLHTPFFRWRPLNNLFAMCNSANLGLPQVLYKYHHLIHHRFANDPIRDGTTKDPSSTYRYGRDGRQEGFVRYSALGLFRDGTSHAYREALRHGQRAQFWRELSVIAVVVAVWIAIDWRWFLAGYLPLFYVGWFLALMENYFEHYRATDPANRMADSVSYYRPIYNRLMFNEGYHQEHHLKPHLHWTRRPAVHHQHREQFERAQAYSARFPPLLGFFD